MTQTTAEQRAEAARLLALYTARKGCWSDDVADQLLALLPALLADAEALAAIEPWSRLYGLTPTDASAADLCPCPRCGAIHPAKGA